MEEKTLDLTCFNRANFVGVIRIRHIADWANDYWKNGYKLSRIKLFHDEYKQLIEEIIDDVRYMKKTPMETMSINLGFGEIEIIDVDRKE